MVTVGKQFSASFVFLSYSEHRENVNQFYWLMQSRQVCTQLTADIEVSHLSHLHIPLLRHWKRETLDLTDKGEMFNEQSKRDRQKEKGKRK